MTIKDIINKELPDFEGICINDRFPLEILREEMCLTMAWKLNQERVGGYKKILIAGNDEYSCKEHFNKKYNKNFEINQRGKYFIADIEDVISVREAIESKKWDAAIQEHDDYYDWISYQIENKEYNSLDSRYIIKFENPTGIKEFKQKYFSFYRNPILYINKQTSKSDKMNIYSIEKKNFLNYSNFKLDFSPNINLIIGKNNTGKTSLLKFMYCIVKSIEEFENQRNTYGRSYKELFSRKIQQVFHSKNGIGTLVKKQSDEELSATIRIDNKNAIDFSFKSTTRTEVSKLESNTEKIEYTNCNAVFIPSKEILSAFRIIRSAFEDNKFGFDATYADLIKQINKPFAKISNKEFSNIISQIEKNVIRGTIEQDLQEDRFIYKNNSGQEFEMTMTAEGIRQMGVIPLLIKTGELNENTVLFLDEPDNNLNPVAITRFVQTLIELSRQGVQIFITSHNYFILKRLHIEARKNQQLAVNVFSLIENDKNQVIDIETKDLKTGMPEYNPIVQEALDMFADEIQTELNA